MQGSHRFDRKWGEQASQVSDELVMGNNLRLLHLPLLPEYGVTTVDHVCVLAASLTGSLSG
ncbi:hypothetical protein J6590_051496 [Homalodisca vitripennis]|nr:hypothetical protein J6590_051496 [Homalodisca vitripennis]